MFMNLREKYGDLVYLRLGNLSSYVLYHPEHLESVLVKNHRSYMKDQVTRDLSTMLGQGLLTSNGTYWQQQRKLVAPPLQRHHIQRFAKTMSEESFSFRHEMDLDSEVDVVPLMMKLTLTIVGETLFGSNVESTAHTMGEALEVVMDAFISEQRTWQRLIPKFVPTPNRKRVQKACDAIEAVLSEIITERRKEKEEREDLLSRLLMACDEDGIGMTDEQLRDECITLFVAGHETTALALSFTLYLLAKHPEIQERLYQETHCQLGGKPPTFEDLENLPFVDAVISESLRLYPPAYIIGREAIEETTIGPYKAPKGMQILIPVYALHRDERYYPEPDLFSPERWLNGLAKTLPRFAFMPFGGGPRICVGNHFAGMELKIVLTTLIQLFQFDSSNPNPPDLTPSITLRPTDGIKLHIRKRSDGNP